jgi:hypothetical protein
VTEQQQVCIFRQPFLSTFERSVAPSAGRLSGPLLAGNHRPLATKLSKVATLALPSLLKLPYPQELPLLTPALGPFLNDITAYLIDFLFITERSSCKNFPPGPPSATDQHQGFRIRRPSLIRSVTSTRSKRSETRGG